MNEDLPPISVTGRTDGERAPLSNGANGGDRLSALDAAVAPANSPAQRRALGWLALLACMALVWLALPVGGGLLLGMLLGFTLQPAYERMRERNISPLVAALTCALGASFGLAGVLIFLGVLIIERSLALMALAPSALATDGPLRRFAAGFEPTLARLHVSSDEVVARARHQAASIGERITHLLAEIANVTFGGLLTFFFMTMTAFFVLRHWHKLVEQAELTLPLHPKNTHALLDEFRVVGRRVLLGTLLTGLAQGTFAGLGYWISGAPEPALFGAVTALASLVPAIGTLLIWIPLGLFLLATGHPVGGAFELIWCTLIVGIVTDYVIRPKLVGSDDGVPTLLTFIALFGGAEVFGLLGLVLGPVIVTLAVALIRTYQAEISAVRKTLVPPQPE